MEEQPLEEQPSEEQLFEEEPFEEELWEEQPFDYYEHANIIAGIVGNEVMKQLITLVKNEPELAHFDFEIEFEIYYLIINQIYSLRISCSPQLPGACYDIDSLRELPLEIYLGLSKKDENSRIVISEKEFQNIEKDFSNVEPVIAEIICITKSYSSL